MSERGRLSERLKQWAIFSLLWLISTGIAITVRFKVVGYDKLTGVVSAGRGGLVLPWHGVTMLPIYYCRGMGFYALVSLSRDGELQNKLLRSRGFKTVRGSSGRGGARALLELTRRLQEGGVMAHTPDGPKGPVKKVQPGTVYLAKRSGCPVLPVGVACRPAKRLSSWDSHMIPYPFARAVIYFGDVLHIARDEDDATAAVRIEEAINAAEQSAWAVLEGGRAA
ncbi:MAG: lysophospholipid acyltransferase family protein [Armatimonadota bacterium]|jgi:lysophospholipid acyltransferase (LPLAT)-like uncharacterized protein